MYLALFVCGMCELVNVMIVSINAFRMMLYVHLMIYNFLHRLCCTKYLLLVCVCVCVLRVTA